LVVLSSKFPFSSDHLRSFIFCDSLSFCLSDGDGRSFVFKDSVIGSCFSSSVQLVSSGFDRSASLKNSRDFSPSIDSIQSLLVISSDFSGSAVRLSASNFLVSLSAAGSVRFFSFESYPQSVIWQGSSAFSLTTRFSYSANSILTAIVNPSVQLAMSPWPESLVFRLSFSIAVSRIPFSSSAFSDSFGIDLSRASNLQFAMATREFYPPSGRASSSPFTGSLSFGMTFVFDIRIASFSRSMPAVLSRGL